MKAPWSVADSVEVCAERGRAGRATADAIYQDIASRLPEADEYDYTSRPVLLRVTRSLTPVLAAECLPEGTCRNYLRRGATSCDSSRNHATYASVSPFSASRFGPPDPSASSRPTRR